MLHLDPRQPLDSAIAGAFQETLDDFLSEQAPLVEEVGAAPLLAMARTYIAGGKRLRPAFGFWSYVAAAGVPEDPRALLRAVASLDLLHVAALAHDDLIDDSDTRRGGPSAHVWYARQHADRVGEGDAKRYGDAATILLGDMLLMWSTECYETSGLPADALLRARHLLHTMRTEVTCGQYLDVAASFGMTDAATLEEHMDVTRRILEYKSARYSVRRPCQVGASLAGASDELLDALGEYGSALGNAFQLRDDVLGVFGNPEVTGKPAGDDLREGKRTLLVMAALRDGSEDEREALRSMLAVDLDEEQVSAARRIITDTGALANTEAQISAEAHRALTALDQAQVTNEGRVALGRLVELAVHREF